MKDTTLDESRFRTLCAEGGRSSDFAEAALTDMHQPAAEPEAKGMLPTLSMGIPGRRTSLDLMKEVFAETHDDFTSFCAHMATRTVCPAKYYLPFWQWLQETSPGAARSPCAKGPARVPVAQKPPTKPLGDLSDADIVAEWLAWFVRQDLAAWVGAHPGPLLPSPEDVCIGDWLNGNHHIPAIFISEAGCGEGWSYGSYLRAGEWRVCIRVVSPYAPETENQAETNTRRALVSLISEWASDPGLVNRFEAALSDKGDNVILTLRAFGEHNFPTYRYLDSMHGALAHVQSLGILEGTLVCPTAAARRQRIEEHRNQEASRLAEQRRTFDVMRHRRSAHQCVNCGRALGAVDRLLMRRHHVACTTYRD